MESYINQVIDYCMPLLRQLETLLWSVPPEVLWGVGAGLLGILVLIQIVRAVRRPKQQGLPSQDDHPDEAAAVLETAGLPKAEPQPQMDISADQAEAAVPEQPVPVVAEAEPVSFFKRLKSGLSKTRDSLAGGLDRIFSGSQQLNDETLEELEELLITSDVGVRTTMGLVEKIGEKASEITDAAALKKTLRREILKVIQGGQTGGTGQDTAKPYVIMVVGVNGVGKTTTIGKLAARFKEQGKKVLIVAADTFRAAAGEQLSIWAERSGARIVKHRDGADPAAVAFDGVEAAVARGIDVVLVDTAGRLHTKVNLMEELKKIRRTITKKLPDAPHEVLMVLDATTGQNALTQAKLFHEAIGLTSIALTKLDGTAKGGIVVGISDELKIPLKYIGVGEQIDDLQAFEPEQFVDALL